jgi:hypothetical protein
MMQVSDMVAFYPESNGGSAMESAGGDLGSTTQATSETHLVFSE